MKSDRAENFRGAGTMEPRTFDRRKGDDMRKCVCIFVGLLALMLMYNEFPTQLKSSAYASEHGLTQQQLDYYSDSFDKFQEGIWVKAEPIIPKKVQKKNFKNADIAIEDGSLKITTKKGGFSTGVIVFKDSLRGDFDLQIDCDMNFLEGEVNIDQRLFFVVRNVGVSFKKSNRNTFFLVKLRKSNKSYLETNYAKYGEFHFGKRIELKDFKGTLRFMRKDKKIHLLFKLNQETEWTKMSTFPCTRKDFKVIIGLNNFIGKRTSINADVSTSVYIDNFKINSAQSIIEEDI